MNRDHQEEEVKLTLLHEEGLHRLLSHLGEPLRTAEQENEYFDTPGGDLRNARAMLRIRRQSGQVIVTTKSDAQILVGGLKCREVEFVSSEEEIAPWITRGLEHWAITPVSHALSFAPEGASLVSLGSSINVRRYYEQPNEGTLEVDRTLLPDGSIHVEIELETTQMETELARLRALLERLNILYTDQVIPKFQRFLAAKGFLL
jgi:uncharacterized protein YjbK